MNVLIINQFASTPRYSTGAGERFYFLGEEFKNKGVSTTVISAAFNHLFLEFPSDEKLFNIEETKGGKFIWVKVRKYSAQSKIGRVWAFFDFLYKLFLIPKAMIGKPDIVIVSSMSIFPIFYALFLKWKLKIPFVLEIRDIWPLTPIEIGSYSPNHPFMKLINYVANVGYKKSDCVVSVLPNFNDFLNINKLQYKRFEYIPNGIKIDKDEINFIKKEKSEKFIVAYTGALGEANALEFFVEAATLFNKEDNIEFWIVGSGPEKACLVKLANNVEWIKFFDKVPKNKVINMLHQSDCTYIGWHNKSLYNYGISANKYNDYMLSGRPIISSSSIINDPVLLANCGIQVESENIQSIYRGIKQMVNSTLDDRINWGKNGINFVILNKGYDKLAQNYLTLFNSLKDIQKK
jgi:glycosyltransferase involved in cell wall biosynthesis